MSVPTNGSGPSFRQVLHWLTGAYPEGIPSPDRYALVTLLAGKLPVAQIQQVMQLLHPSELDPDPALTADDVATLVAHIADNPPPPDDVRHVASRLARAGWPLQGLD